ncbi:MAG: hypothetical protein ACHREM_21690 [Polyangiales bacterium]
MSSCLPYACGATACNTTCAADTDCDAAATCVSGVCTVGSQPIVLVATDGATDNNFGISVAMSGSLAVIGADNKQPPGAAYIFAESGSSWTQQAELYPSDGAAMDMFGNSVAIDGTTAIVGAFRKSIGPNTGEGAAYAFVQNGATWSQQQELVATGFGVTQYGFGSSVAVSGTTAIVGADAAYVNELGAAYVFTQHAAVWTQQQKLFASDGAYGSGGSGDSFGCSAALDGTTAIVGARAAHAGKGQAYIFVLSGATWNQQQVLAASDGAAAEYFGSSVAIAGTTAVIGAPGGNVAYVFVQTGSTWSQQPDLRPSDSTTKAFGSSVAIHGTTVLVGAGGTLSLTGTDTAYLFTQTGTTWKQQTKFGHASGTSDTKFGFSVALTSTEALIGAPFETVGTASYQGAAYLYALTTTKPLAAACTASTDCASGLCVDGVCCATSCTATCYYCDLPTTAGTCTAVTAATDPHGVCAGTCTAGTCVGGADGGFPDASAETETGAPDVAPPDTSAADGGSFDAGPVDATVDAGISAQSPGGSCSCLLGPGADVSGETTRIWVGAAIGLVSIARRRRGRC